MDDENLSLNAAALSAGLDIKMLRQWIRTGKCPFGVYVRSEGAKRGGYYVNRTRFERWCSGDDMHPRCPYHAIT